MFSVSFVNSTVVIRDSVINWQHHRYSLNADYSMASMTKVDNDIVTVQFNGKVIENELFRIVLVPEFGGRVLSYFYKPTSHEYLYQSACGTPYGIGAGNFYYNWLMVYGGIFPTFPEPEHGKTWLKPWQYTVIHNTSDSVIVKMSLTDNSEYSGRPGQFNNGVTGIICELEVGVYSGRSDFTFNVKLTNPALQTKKFEYWTCTTLAPGSQTGNTFTPVNSEIISPMTQYEAAWSPNNWIGKYGDSFDFSKINMLNEWTDMGIGYALNRTDDYWGVINHENDEGFFRIADRNDTRGLKLWTWGKNAKNANVFQISNGGKDDYIELWGGVSMRFFDDAQFPINSSMFSNENFFPTIGLSEINAMNKTGAINFDVKANQEINKFDFVLNGFFTHANNSLSTHCYINDDISPAFSNNFISNELGNQIQNTFVSDKFINGTNTIKTIIRDENSRILLSAQKQFQLMNTSLYQTDEDNIRIINIGNKTVSVRLNSVESALLSVYSTQGINVFESEIINNIQFQVYNSGIYIIKLKFENKTIERKLIVK